jgi:hypothetical protein
MSSIPKPSAMLMASGFLNQRDDDCFVRAAAARR